MFCSQSSPNRVSSIADAVPLDQFPRHGREHVIVFIDALQSPANMVGLPEEHVLGNLH